MTNAAVKNNHLRVSMEERIAKEVGNQDPAKVKMLNLDDCRSANVVGLEKFTNLNFLSMNCIGLTSLSGLPLLPNLINVSNQLEACDNKISDGLSIIKTNCPKLSTLILSGNRIKDFNEIASLQGLENLTSLDLFDCEVTRIDDYRTKVFQLFPKLKYLDDLDVNNVERFPTSSGSDKFSETEEDENDEVDESESELSDEYDEEKGGAYMENSEPSAKRLKNEEDEEYEEFDEEEEEEAAEAED